MNDQPNPGQLLITDSGLAIFSTGGGIWSHACALLIACGGGAANTPLTNISIITATKIKPMIFFILIALLPLLICNEIV
ncbi:hypothetical protein HYX04_05285 [Candidatus Woesearchaeota archaeon]|nr:hypothetical protein [Candidatus Woesearchaeota archaeon]